MSTATTKKNGIDLFVEGAKQGWIIATTSMLPNVIMAFVVIQILTITKLLDIIGTYAAPIMGLWGLPGEAIVVLLTAFLSMGGSVGMTVGLSTAGKLSNMDVTVLAPAIMLMGALLQYIGRCLGTSGSNPRYWGWQIGVCILNAMIAMWIMRIIVVAMPA